MQAYNILVLINDTSLEAIRSVAIMTRRDFEQGAVTDAEILEAAIALDAITLIADVHLTDKLVEGKSELATPRPTNPHFAYFIRPSLWRPDMFPLKQCRPATILLAKRITDIGIVGLEVEIVEEGGCGEDKDSLDPSSYFDNLHTFTSIGKTSLGEDTIVDITGDQFKEVKESVYIGPLQFPWTRTPRSVTDDM